MIITIASGKGGTGKTTFAVNLAYALSGAGKNVRLLDCDVEEPNDHLFVNPEWEGEENVTALKPVLDQEKCTGCGECAEACGYNAIAVVKGKVLIFNELCHSCGVCSYVCPENALTEASETIGKTQSSNSGDFFFAHGLLNIGEALAPNVVRAVKAYHHPESINIIDASPGTACPVVEATEDADLVVLVTEPTPFGLNDLKLAAGLSLQQRIPTGIVVNRSDGEDAIIQEYSDQTGIPIIGRIPFKREYAVTYSSGNILSKDYPEFNSNMLSIFEEILNLKQMEVPPVPEQDIFLVSEKASPDFPVGNAANFKEVTIISGKGGTGKTTISASFAQLAEEKVIADNDVDAADMHILIKPAIIESHDFSGGVNAFIEKDLCTACGLCYQYCHFNAIRFDGPPNSKHEKTYRIDPLACEGCGLCPLVCPENAISTEDMINGQWYVSSTDYGPMVHARLGIAEENSGRLVTEVRNHAAELASKYRMRNIITDGPPGTGCPVIASLSGTDLVLIVTEPTTSGVHDLERVFQLAGHFNLPTRVIINKYDLNKEQVSRIETITRQYGSSILGKIPFDRNINDALMAGKTIIDYGKGPALEEVNSIWEDLKKII